MTSATPKPRAGEYTKDADPGEPDEAWMHAACLTIAETGRKWGESVHPSPAMQAVFKLRTERDEFKDRALASESNFRGLHDDFLALQAERGLLREALERINLRFYNFDNQHPSLATNEAARQLLADIEADISGALAKHGR